MITQPVPNVTARRGQRVQLCLMECNKVKDENIRTACYRRCIRGYLESLFAAVSQTAQQMDKHPTDIFVSLKTEFDEQFEKALKYQQPAIQSQEPAPKSQDERTLTATSACSTR